MIFRRSNTFLVDTRIAIPFVDYSHTFFYLPLRLNLRYDLEPIVRSGSSMLWLLFKTYDVCPNIKGIIKELHSFSLWRACFLSNTQNSCKLCQRFRPIVSVVIMALDEHGIVRSIEVLRSVTLLCLHNSPFSSPLFCQLAAVIIPLLQMLITLRHVLTIPTDNFDSLI